MPSFNAISTEQLARLIGTPACPLLIDRRAGDDPRSIPGSARVPIEQVDAPRVVTICDDGGARCHGAAAMCGRAGSRRRRWRAGLRAGWRQAS